VGKEAGYTVFVEPKEVNIRRRHRVDFEDNITRDLKDIWGHELDPFGFRKTELVEEQRTS